MTLNVSDIIAFSTAYGELNMSSNKTLKARTKHPAYTNWYEMLRRCFNPKNKRYKNYAERGISVHPDFVESFDKFLAEVGEKPEGKGVSLGRIDNNGWYTYGNIRWETKEQQARNHTKQSNNTSGVTGVKLQKTHLYGRDYFAWVAFWNVDGRKRQSKSFSWNKYGGDEKAKELAIAYRKQKIEELNMAGFGYADSHGTN